MAIRCLRMRWICVTVAIVLVSLTLTAAPSAADDQLQPDPTASLTFVVALPHDSAALSRAARAASSPTSPSFRGYLTLRDAAATYGARPAAVARLNRAVTRLGLTATLDPTRLLARVTGPVATWERIMGQAVTFQPASGSSAQTDPLGPFDTYLFQRGGELLGVPQALAGLVTAIIPRYQEYVPSLDVAGIPAAKAPTSTSAGAGSVRTLDYPGKGSAALPTNTGAPLGPSCLTAEEQLANFTPSQVSQAYGLDDLQAGYGRSAGHRLAVISLGGGFLQSDVEAAAACFGHTAPRIDVRTGIGMPGPFVSAGAETTLDLQTVAWALQRARSVRLVQVPVLGAGLIDAFSLALTGWSTIPDTISTSFGLCETASPESAGSIVGSRDTLEDLFRFAAVVGTTTVFSAGDTGSSACQVSAAQAGDEGGAAAAASTVFYPASSPFVTAVGGTQLTLGPANVRLGESVWNDLQYTLPVPSTNLAGGGGPSQVFSAPWYQRPLTGSNMRTVPDVAAQAGVGPGLPLFFGGTLLSGVGGTSQAGPITAAGLALLSARLRASGRPPLGFANPWLYDAARRQPAVVFDVTDGDNQYPVAYAVDSVNIPACCQATPGYDAASGLGAPLFDRLSTAS